MMNDTLLYSLATLGIAFLTIVVRYSFKSKCTNVSLCFGCVEIERNIEMEVELEENTPNSPNKEESKI